MKKKALLTSILTIIMCLSLSVGATFALFTSTSEVNIAVTSGTVDVKATVDTLKYKTLTVKEWTAFDTDSNTTNFDNLGGSATVDGGNVTLNKIVPGDALSFNVTVTNYSNVTAKYRTIIKNAEDSDEYLYSALDIKVNGYTFNGLVSTPWITIEGVNGSAHLATIPVSITLPEEVDGAEYMGKTVKLLVVVEAIQGNAETEDIISVSKDVEVSNGVITEDSAIDTEFAKAEVSEGTKFNDGATTMTLNVNPAEDGVNTGLKAIVNPDKVTPLTIKIPEVAEDNTQLIKVTLKEVATKNLSAGQVSVYHSGVAMAQKNSVEELVADSFYYDANTGDIVIAIVNFSNFTVIEGGEVKENAINNLNGLKAFRDKVNAGNTFSGKTVELLADIDMSGEESWFPIGSTSAKCFSGTFDGNGHTISNLTVVQDINYGNGLFGNLVGGAIKNLTIDNAYVSRRFDNTFSGNAYGIVTGYAYGKCTIENVHVINSKIKGFGKVGAIIGMTGGDQVPSTITNCSVVNTEVLGTYNTAAIVGLQNVGDTVTFADCIVDGVKITADPTDVYYVYEGGIYWDYSTAKAYAGLAAVMTDYVQSKNGAQVLAGATHNEVTGVKVSNVTFNVAGEDLTYKTVSIVDGVKITNYHLKGQVWATITEEAPAKVIIPEGVTHLSSKCMQGNTTVKEVVIPASVVYYGATVNAAGNSASGGMFYKSSVEKITLPEGITEIQGGTFNQAAMLKEVNIPSSVTKIGVNAFAGSGLTSITLGANITEIGYGAFRDMANLETVTIENSMYIPTYAFRTCNKLRTIYLKGEDVTFGSGMVFSYNDSNNDFEKATTIYVANEIVKARLELNGQFKGEIIVENPDESVATVTNNDTLDAAIKAGKTTILLKTGSYVIPVSAQNKTIKFVGVGNATVTIPDSINNYPDYALQGATATFENITFKTNNVGYTGYASLTGTFVNCTFDGCIFLYGNSTFNGCTFNIADDNYNVWTWAAAVATFDNCTFNSDGKALLLYGGANTKLTVNNCVFNDNGGLTDMKAAIEIGDSYGMSYELIVNNTVVNGYEINDAGINTGSTLWGNKNSMSTEKLNVVVDGVDVY